VSVSIASVSERNFTPRARRSSIAIRSRKLRPSRSSFQTMSASPVAVFHAPNLRQTYETCKPLILWALARASKLTLFETR
jgi:hypothetical protein